MAKGGSPYGDGRAAERIAGLVAAAVRARPHPRWPDSMIRLPGAALGDAAEAAVPPPAMSVPSSGGPAAR